MHWRQNEWRHPSVSRPPSVPTWSMHIAQSSIVPPAERGVRLSFAFFFKRLLGVVALLRLPGVRMVTFLLLRPGVLPAGMLFWRDANAARVAERVTRPDMPPRRAWQSEEASNSGSAGGGDVDVAPCAGLAI
eukprot:1715826-Prymnesium_polylepis.1